MDSQCNTQHIDGDMSENIAFEAENPLKEHENDSSTLTESNIGIEGNVVADKEGIESIALRKESLIKRFESDTNAHVTTECVGLDAEISLSEEDLLAGSSIVALRTQSLLERYEQDKSYRRNSSLEDKELSYGSENPLTARQESFEKCTTDGQEASSLTQREMISGELGNLTPIGNMGFFCKREI